MLKLIRNFLNGIVFGLTVIIPGVSGGTIALVLGFYYELLEAINGLTKNFRKSFFFLIPLAIGTITGVLFFTSIINFLLEHYSFQIMLFLTGLICGIIPFIFAKTRNAGGKFGFNDYVLITIPFVVLLFVSFQQGLSITNPAEFVGSITIPFMAFIFFGGVLSAAALIIPGMSGSLVLLLLGIYPLAIYSVSSIRFLLADFSNIALIFDICKVLIPLALGIIIGILFTAKLIVNMLKNYHRQVYLVMMGLIPGSVFVMLKNLIANASNESGISLLAVFIGIAAFFGGVVISYITTRAQDKLPGHKVQRGV